jgi:hypothetical protein
VDVICELALVDAAGREKNTHTLERGDKIAGHASLAFQLEGICSMKHSVEGYPIIDLDVAMNEAERLVLDEQGYIMVDSFARYGLAGCTLWVSTKTPADESELYSFRLLSAMVWFNKKLLRIVKSYNFSEDDMFAIRSVFDTITGSYEAEVVRVSDLVEHMGLSKTKLFEWVVGGINPGSKVEINFTEYVYLISYYPMFAKRELNQFLFGAMDVDNKMYLT